MYDTKQVLEIMKQTLSQQGLQQFTKVLIKMKAVKSTDSEEAEKLFEEIYFILFGSKKPKHFDSTHKSLAKNVECLVALHDIIP